MKIVAYNLVKIMIMLNGDDGNDHIPYDNDDCKCGVWRPLKLLYYSRVPRIPTL